MIDFYEELSLSRKLDTKQIQEELVRLESLWHKREVNSPEKANKMLGIIMDAQKVFVSEASRKKYDNDLEASLREPEDSDVLRSKSLEMYSNQARHSTVMDNMILQKSLLQKQYLCQMLTVTMMLYLH